MAQQSKPLVEGKYLEYLDKPLVREGDTICYGDMNEKCVLVLEIMSYKKFNDTEIPDKILIQILDTKDPNKIYKQATKDGIYEAFRMGEIWLEQALMS